MTVKQFVTALRAVEATGHKPALRDGRIRFCDARGNHGHCPLNAVNRFKHRLGHGGADAHALGLTDKAAWAIIVAADFATLTSLRHRVIRAAMLNALGLMEKPDEA